MKIAHIAPPWLVIPPKNYGGTEIVLYNLIEEEVAQGHDVTLFAHGDARTSARLISFFPHSLIDASSSHACENRRFRSEVESGLSGCSEHRRSRIRSTGDYQ